MPRMPNGSLYPDFELFWEAMELLYRDYYGERPESEAATYAAIRSVLGLLEDPNTSFMTPEEAEFFRTHIEGSFEGIGARVGWDQEANTLIITEPFENQPAWKAGIRRDDLILAVDGESVVGTDVSQAVQKIRGPKGSTVVLTVVREGFTEPFDVEVVRDIIEIPTITTNMLGENENIGYVRLNSFNENAGQLVRQAVDDAMARDAVALVFDLRGNSGGLLREAVKVTSVFLQDQVVLIERFSDGKTETYRTNGKALVKEIPIVVLVNGGSASASEIVAGAMQDAGRATLIGEKTFGKGSVQLPHTMSNGAIMRVTVARWYTPLDRSIDGLGLEPDITIAIDPEAEPSPEDPQLDAALEHLQEEIQE
ncbi:MAG: S41 family peptidase [Caldilineaceae bacterium]|nr:S41 family peptidase [Caldilineaceae bacterium]